MAGQPNISSILATLGKCIVLDVPLGAVQLLMPHLIAGPQSIGRPPYPPQMPPHHQQQQQQQQPPQYHATQLPPRPQAQPQYPTQYQPAPAPVPQPNGSGMINLFDVRPSNSGSVSLASAPPPHQIAYPAPVRSGYSLRRSRSRSPQRSTPTQYNTNYNPYREERRADSQVSYVRDQASSIRDSPASRYSPLTGRRVSGTAQASSPESHTETVQIESSVVGLVIGRQGENMRRLEAETRTRIQFAPASESSGPMRKCTITGSKAAIEHAINEIDRTIEENDKGPKGGSGRAPPPPGRNLSVEPPSNGGSKSAPRKEEATLIIQVPSKTVGLIIGKRGESIKDLQDRSHCHVNIMPEEATVNGLRPVHLLGTPQQAAVAHAMIMDIVNTDSKKLPDHGAGARDGVNSMALGARTSSNEKITDGIIVPSEAVGMIIGKGGETIRDMQDATGCKINVSQPSGRDVEREIELIGSRSAIQEAKAGILEKVRAVVGCPLRSCFICHTDPVIAREE